MLQSVQLAVLQNAYIHAKIVLVFGTAKLSKREKSYASSSVVKWSMFRIDYEMMIVLLFILGYRDLEHNRCAFVKFYRQERFWHINYSPAACSAFLKNNKLKREALKWLFFTSMEKTGHKDVRFKCVFKKYQHLHGEKNPLTATKRYRNIHY